MGRGDWLKQIVVKVQWNATELVILEKSREDRNSTISLNANTGKGGASTICQQEQELFAE